MNKFLRESEKGFDRIDTEAGVIYGVKVLGPKSRNGRIYEDAAIRRAVPMYEGVTVNLNHQRIESGSRAVPDRQIQDRWGVLRNARYAEGSVYADLHYLKNHPMTPQLIEAADRFPDTFGLSHDAAGTLGGYGAVPNWSSYNIDTSMGTDTITLDSSMFTTGSITSPYTYTTTGTGGYTISTNPSTVRIDTDGLTMKEGADIVVGGKSLTQAIEKIEERLAILKPNTELESRWEQLKELRNLYVELERDLLEKEKIMKILK